MTCHHSALLHPPWFFCSISARLWNQWSGKGQTAIAGSTGTNWYHHQPPLRTKMGSHRPSPFILDLFWFGAYCRWPLVSSDHPQHQVGSFGMTEDNTVTVLGIASLWVAYTSLEVTWAVLPPALTLVVRECMHAVRDVFTTAATAHVASCNHYGLHREFSHILSYSPVPARSVCGNFRVHHRCLQDQLNTIWEM